ncbi:MAG: UDP-3-O-(3-hydroxymyristoyl)glucosamine N-acyltransferase [Alkalilacustris sp.]
MAHKVSDIAAGLGAAWEGDGDLAVSGAAEPGAAGPGDLALAMKPAYAEGLAQGAARAAVLWAGADWRALGLRAAIFVDRPRMALAGVTRLLDPFHPLPEGVHPAAIIHPTAELGEGVAVGPFAVVGAGVRLGAGCRVFSHVSIGPGTVIGRDGLLLEGVRIGARVRIGDRVILHPGAVIGADGFSFVTAEKSGVEAVRETLGAAGERAPQKWQRIHSLGAVVLGDDVEVGANSAIDRGTVRDTSVGDGTKIDNLVQVGHNVQIGRDCLLCGQSGVAGSARIGDRVVIGGRVAVNDNIFVGDDVIAGGGAMIFTNAPSGRVLMGNPAVRMETQIEINKALRRLPRLMKKLGWGVPPGPEKPVFKDSGSD